MVGVGARGGDKIGSLTDFYELAPMCLQGYPSESSPGLTGNNITWVRVTDGTTFCSVATDAGKLEK